MKSNKKSVKKETLSSDQINHLGEASVRDYVQTEFDVHGSINEHRQKTKILTAPNHIKISFPKLIFYPVILIVFIGLSWLYIGSRLSYFNLDGTKIKASQLNSDLNPAVNKLTGSYKLGVVYPDKTTKSYSLSSIGLSVDTQSTLANFKSQNSLKTDILWWQPKTAKIAFNRNQKTFSSFISGATQIVIDPPVNAKLTISGSTVNIENGVNGTEYGLTNSSNHIISIASNLDTNPVYLKKISLSPNVSSNQLIKYKDQINTVINQPLALNVSGSLTKPTPAQLASWLALTENSQTGSYAISVNQGLVMDYVNSVGDNYNRPPKAEVLLNNNNSQVIVPGQDGISVSGQTTAADQIDAGLLSGKGLSVSLTSADKPYETISTNDYPKWIEVDLTNKRLYAYQNANLVQTYLVTAGAPATPTVTGQYKIYAKYVSQNMSGENVDGTSYYQPNVPWVNYFYSDYAIHGNYWRPTSYFGNVNSSHGCVGLMVSDALWIYNWAPIGTPVVIHY